MLSNTRLWQLEDARGRASGRGGPSTGFAFHQKSDNSNVIVLQELFESMAIDAQSEERSLKRFFFSLTQNQSFVLCAEQNYNAEQDLNWC